MIVTPATRIPPEFRGQVMSLARVLMGGVGLVLVLACANVAGLLLSRASARGREIAVRRALGAGSARILRQLLTETAVLAFVSAGAGLLIAAWTTDVLPSFFPGGAGGAARRELGLARLRLRARRGGASRRSSSACCRRSDRFVRRWRRRCAVMAGDLTDRAGSRMRELLVGAQVGIACVLLIGSGLLVQSVSHTLNADLGFRDEGRAAAVGRAAALVDAGRRCRVSTTRRAPGSPRFRGSSRRGGCGR